jgi:predicted esterase YcpF (UPF0227 family)
MNIVKLNLSENNYPIETDIMSICRDYLKTNPRDSELCLISDSASVIADVQVAIKDYAIEHSNPLTEGTYKFMGLTVHLIYLESFAEINTYIGKSIDSVFIDGIEYFPYKIK